MAPNEETQQADSEDGENHRAVTEDGFACEGGQDVRRGAHARQNRDVDLRMAKKPEQVLPQNRRATGMQRESSIDTGQQAIDVETAGNKKTRPGKSVEEKQDATAQQNRE